MSLEIYLTEGPNVQGLDEDRVSLYVGYSYRDGEVSSVDSKEPCLVWRVIEGKKIGTVSSYKLHIGEHGKPLEEAEISRFEYTPEKTTVDFQFEGTLGTLTISNKSNLDHYHHGDIDEILQHCYNLFRHEKA